MGMTAEAASRMTVIGAGVVGLSSAVALQRAFPWAKITLATQQLSPHTTGDGSAGLWEPYLLGETPARDIMRWAGSTYRLLHKIWKSEEAGEAGISLMPIIYFTQEDNISLPEWRHLVMGFTLLSTDHLKQLSSEHKRHYKFGFQFLTFTCEPTKFLPMLLKEYKQRGGVIEEYRVTSLSDVAHNSDIVINCTGLQARFLVPDLQVSPIRGQVMRVKAPWVYHCLLDESTKGNYIIPNQETVVLGGTKQRSWDTEADPSDTQDILSGCQALMPSLKSAEIIQQWVGLRPSRYRVRLERESRRADDGTPFEVIHNYGHGGAGLTLCWGCAEDVVSLVRKILQESNQRAKL